MKSKEMYIVRKEESTDSTEANTAAPTLAIIRHLPLTRIQPVFDDCTLAELEYFLERAIGQEEYELCQHLRDLIEIRYRFSVA